MKNTLTAASVKQRALELGFDLCGIAPVGRHAELSFFQEWLGRGYAGEMAYLGESSTQRADVRTVLPGARCVVVTGTLYNTVSADDEATDPSVAHIARYAWGDDYHRVVRRRMDELREWMHETSSDVFESRVYVDTGPVQERVYAQYGGLGWIGKNTCLINAELGSFLFLSEILCTLPLEPDTQGLDGCGSCTRCIDACPTSALVDAHVLDATRCLSYLTIELKGAIPAMLRPALGTHVYGCDICQTVCPYNEAPVTSPDPSWLARAGLDRPSLVDLWSRSDEQLHDLLKGSPMKRAGVAGLRRNLAVAIGNNGDADAIAALCTPADQRPSAESEMVREHVEWALERARQRS